MPDTSFIHRFLPATDQQNTRTLVLLHGTGGNEDDLIPLGRLIDPAAALLSPRGKVLEGTMPRFFRRFPDGSFDQADLTLRTHELADFINAAAEYYQLDATQTVAVGYSNGANIAVNLLLLRPAVLSAAILLRPIFPVDHLSTMYLSGVPILLLAGRQDELTTVERTDELISFLQTSGASVTVHWQEAGHRLTQEDREVATKWLANLKAEQR